MYYEELLAIGSLAKNIKSKLKEQIENYKTVGEVITFIEQTIMSASYKPAFPVLVCQDEVVSNFTYTKDLFQLPLNFKVVTIDFGIMGKNGAIIDTAITFYKKDYGGIYNTYTKNIRLIESKIKQIIKKEKGIWASKISKIVENQFKSTNQLGIISSCGSHLIEPFKLHGKTISMNYDPSLEDHFITQGSVFTIEPHVYIGSKKLNLKSLKSNIVNTENGEIRCVDDRWNSKSKEKFQYKTYYANMLVFYEEQTYVIKNNTLNTLT